jgi:hypothetical protein
VKGNDPFSSRISQRRGEEKGSLPSPDLQVKIRAYLMHSLTYPVIVMPTGPIAVSKRAKISTHVILNNFSPCFRPGDSTVLFGPFLR